MRHRIVTEVRPPAAVNANMVFTPSTTDMVKVLAILVKLRTSAHTENRVPTFAVSDVDGVTYYEAALPYVQFPSVEITYSWAFGAPERRTEKLEFAEPVPVGLPELWLSPGDQVTVSKLFGGNEDQFTTGVIRYMVRDHWRELQEEVALEQALAS